MILLLAGLLSGVDMQVSASGIPCNLAAGPETILRSFVAPVGAITECDTRGMSETFCFQNTAMGGYGGIVLSEPWVIRKITADTVPNIALVSTIRVETEDEGGNFKSYITAPDEASGHSWSLVTTDIRIEGDLTGNSFRLYPISSAAEIPVGAHLEFFGCRLASTELVSLTFRGASMNSIVGRYLSVQNFLSDVQHHLCKILFSTETCDQVVLASVEESADAESGRSQVEVRLRLLPVLCDGAYCASPATLKDQLSQDLQNSESTAFKVMQALEVAVADVQPFICAGKVCGASEMCVEGRCVSMTDLETTSPADILGKPGTNSFKAKTVPLQKLNLDDFLINAAPLAVIQGVPAEKDPLSFQQQRGGGAGAAAEAQNSDFSVLLAPKDQNVGNFKALVGLVACVVIAGLIWFFFF